MTTTPDLAETIASFVGSLRAALAEKEAELTRALALIGQLRAGELKLQLEENARLRERLSELDVIVKATHEYFFGSGNGPELRRLLDAEVARAIRDIKP